MKILYIYAHPEPKSFNGALKDTAMVALSEMKHFVKVSNLYALKFKAVLDQNDFRIRGDTSAFNPAFEQIHGVETGSLAPDIQEEIEKIVWADLLIFQFPVWWSYMPAILKGWIDRVFVQGFVVDIGAGKVYENGLLKGKKAMIVATTGSSLEMYSSGGVHGNLEDQISIITHNIFEFTGLSVLPGFIVYGAAGMSYEQGKRELARYREALMKL
ncbi:MAG TPA: NAD(P)H-dependent oxidoreductase [Methanoregulaceae archaeon]|nr:NAD(P)H-dependent oxidoreductase [Methanoregulaceae archaeon]